MNIKGTGAVLALAFCLSSAFAQDVGPIAPPDVKVIDDIGVNLATGQVTASLDTVSIGGSLGLAHGISMHSNNYPQTGSGRYGYIDRYAGNARYEMLSANGVDQFRYQNVDYPFFKAMRVFGPAGTKDFVVYINGVLDVNVTEAEAETSNYTYKAMGDKRHLLEVVDSGDSDNQYEGNLRWTTPDGTRLYYSHGNTATSGGQLRAIVYPNGLTVTRHTFSSTTGSVTTNTGYQLKYEYSDISQGLSQEKQNIDNSLPNAAIPDINSFWSGSNPVRIVGINNAVEYCDPDYSTTPCSLQHEWPAASFEWPGGMPRAIFLGDTLFKVIDAAGRTTEYHYQAQDVCLENLTDTQCAANSQYVVGERWSPRLVGIKSAESKVINYSYTYENHGQWTEDQSEYRITAITASYAYWRLNSEVGKLVSATGPVRSGGYSMDEDSGYGDDETGFAKKNMGPTITVISEHPSTSRGTLNKVQSDQYGEYRYESGFRNFIETAFPINGPRKDYDYDERGNLISIIMSSNQPDDEDTEITAGYPSTCTMETRKTCNKPLWVKDAMGHQTDYTYHEQSGQVETITKPADKNGIRPQTRYQYDDFYAYYKKNGSTVVEADTPVWLLTREAYCISSDAVGNGCSKSDDEVVTTYDYGPQNGEPNNLQLRSVTVTAPHNQIRRTCYEYDKYGNRIGETPPKGSCPQ